MKVIIAGGRDYQCTEKDFILLCNLNYTYLFTEIVSGKCSGADADGEVFAGDMKIPVKPFPADWDDFSEPCYIKYRNGKPYNARAGEKRNKQMAEYADAIILFPGGKGTSNMRKLAKQYGLKILYDAEASR